MSRGRDGCLTAAAHRTVGRQQGDKNRARTPPSRRSPYTGDKTYGHAYVHIVVDDYSRVAYADIEVRELAVTEPGPCAGRDPFAARSAAVQRVPTDNGSCHRSKSGAASATTWA